MEQQAGRHSSHLNTAFDWTGDEDRDGSVRTVGVLWEATTGEAKGFCHFASGGQPAGHHRVSCTAPGHAAETRGGTR